MNVKQKIDSYNIMMTYYEDVDGSAFEHVGHINSLGDIGTPFDLFFNNLLESSHEPGMETIGNVLRRLKKVHDKIKRSRIAGRPSSESNLLLGLVGASMTSQKWEWSAMWYMKWYLSSSTLLFFDLTNLRKIMSHKAKPSIKMNSLSSVEELVIASDAVSDVTFDQSIVDIRSLFETPANEVPISMTSRRMHSFESFSDNDMTKFLPSYNVNRSRLLEVKNSKKYNFVFWLYFALIDFLREVTNYLVVISTLVASIALYLLLVNIWMISMMRDCCREPKTEDIIVPKSLNRKDFKDHMTHLLSCVKSRLSLTYHKANYFITLMVLLYGYTDYFFSKMRLNLIYSYDGIDKEPRFPRCSISLYRQQFPFLIKRKNVNVNAVSNTHGAVAEELNDLGEQTAKDGETDTNKTKSIPEKVKMCLFIIIVSLILASEVVTSITYNYGEITSHTSVNGTYTEAEEPNTSKTSRVSAFGVFYFLLSIASGLCFPLIFIKGLTAERSDKTSRMQILQAVKEVFWDRMSLELDKEDKTAMSERVEESMKIIISMSKKLSVSMKDCIFHVKTNKTIINDEARLHFLVNFKSPDKSVSFALVMLLLGTTLYLFYVAAEEEPGVRRSTHILQASTLFLSRVIQAKSVGMVMRDADKFKALVKIATDTVSRKSDDLQPNTLGMLENLTHGYRKETAVSHWNANSLQYSSTFSISPRDVKSDGEPVSSDEDILNERRETLIRVMDHCVYGETFTNDRSEKIKQFCLKNSERYLKSLHTLEVLRIAKDQMEHKWAGIPMTVVIGALLNILLLTINYSLNDFSSSETAVHSNVLDSLFFLLLIGRVNYCVSSVNLMIDRLTSEMSGYLELIHGGNLCSGNLSDYLADAEVGFSLPSLTVYPSQMILPHLVILDETEVFVLTIASASIPLLLVIYKILTV